jgi:hypothetical protein
MNDYSPSVIKHLELIQGAVSRMAGNSFSLKGWSVTLVSALFALAAKDANPRYVLVAYFPAIMFWLLDGFYLSQERTYRGLFDIVRSNPTALSDLSMETKQFLNGDRTWSRSALSKTLVLFHGGLIGTILVVMCIAIWSA